MKCQRCRSDNSDTRRFCGECGAALVKCCVRCGFGNSPEDKFCGGCGIGIAESASAAEGGIQTPVSDIGGRYTSDELKDLLDKQTPRKSIPPKKIAPKETEAVSQDLLDSFFDSSEGGS